MIDFIKALCVVALFIYPIARVEYFGLEIRATQFQQKLLAQGMSDLKLAQEKLDGEIEDEKEAFARDMRDEHNMEQYGKPLPNKYKRSTLEDEKPKKKKQKATFTAQEYEDEEE